MCSLYLFLLALATQGLPVRDESGLRPAAIVRSATACANDHKIVLGTFHRGWSVVEAVDVRPI